MRSDCGVASVPGRVIVVILGVVMRERVVPVACSMLTLREVADVCDWGGIVVFCRDDDTDVVAVFRRVAARAMSPASSAAA